MQSIDLELTDEAATQQFAGRLAQSIQTGCVHLIGDLGAGKTTLVRAWLRSIGITGTIKSPTYTLVEPYEGAQGMIYHFDLYRLTDPEELDMIGIRDYAADATALIFIEWPQLGGEYTPPADWEIKLDASDKSASDQGRQARLTAISAVAQTQLEQFNLKQYFQ